MAKNHIFRGRHGVICGYRSIKAEGKKAKAKFYRRQGKYVCRNWEH